MDSLLEQKKVGWDIRSSITSMGKSHVKLPFFQRDIHFMTPKWDIYS